MMRHQTILHRKWWGAHARCCCCRFSRLYTTRRSRAERGLYSTPFAWTICIEIGEFFHFKRETYIHRRGYRKPANEPPALNIHNITTLYYYDDYYYTSCIMYNCQNVPFHFFRKYFNDKEKIRDLDPKCNLTIFSAPCSSYDITHTRHLCAYNSVQRLSLVYLGGTKTRSLGGRKIFFPKCLLKCWPLLLYQTTREERAETVSPSPPWQDFYASCEGVLDSSYSYTGSFIFLLFSNNLLLEIVSLLDVLRAEGGNCLVSCPPPPTVCLSLSLKLVQTTKTIKSPQENTFFQRFPGSTPPSLPLL
jgi:hypothetical protein